jgi:hypothetical protein
MEPQPRTGTEAVRSAVVTRIYERSMKRTSLSSVGMQGCYDLGMLNAPMINSVSNASDDMVMTMLF